MILRCRLLSLSYSTEPTLEMRLVEKPPTIRACDAWGSGWTCAVFLYLRTMSWGVTCESVAPWESIVRNARVLCGSRKTNPGEF